MTGVGRGSKDTRRVGGWLCWGLLGQVAKGGKLSHPQQRQGPRAKVGCPKEELASGTQVLEAEAESNLEVAAEK